MEASCLKPAKINSLAREKRFQPQIYENFHHPDNTKIYLRFVFIVRKVCACGDFSVPLVGLMLLMMRLSFDPVENRLRECVKLIRTFGFVVCPFLPSFYTACVFSLIRHWYLCACVHAYVCWYFAVAFSFIATFR